MEYENLTETENKLTILLSVMTGYSQADVRANLLYLWQEFFKDTSYRTFLEEWQEIIEQSNGKIMPF